jgi:hypothetical protein
MLIINGLVAIVGATIVLYVCLRLQNLECPLRPSLIIYGVIQL